MDNRYLRDKAKRRMRRRRDSRYYDGTYYPEDYAYGERHYNDRRSDYHGMPTPYVMPTHYNVGHYLYGQDGAADMHKYHKDLETWMHKLKRHDRFGLPKEEVLKKAKDMGVKFHNYDEMEFYVTYLMLISDFKHIFNDPHQYLSMAKDWLEDDDIERRGSEKLCAYLYTIVLDEEDED